MAEVSKIQWTDATFNPWRGCTKVSAGCTNCYAEKLSHRNPGVLGVWGPNGTRVVAAESYWWQPLKWDREAEASHGRKRVFCASLADIWEARAELHAPRERLFGLIDRTPNLDWLIVTKRPENWTSYSLTGWQAGKQWGACKPTRRDITRPNVWALTSTEDQERADERIPHLLRIPAVVRGLSAEPLLGPLDLSRWMGFRMGEDEARPGLDWVIVGGESGPGARPCNAGWVRSIVRQCSDAGVACFVKQLGAEPRPSVLPSDVAVRFIRDRKGGNIEEWPEDLRIREFPTAREARNG